MKKIMIRKSLSLALAVLSLIMLFAPVYYDLYYNGYYYEWMLDVYNGFHLLAFSDFAGEYAYLLGIVSLMQLLGAIALLVINIISLLKKKNDSKTSLITIILSNCLALTYLIEGIAFVAIMGSGTTFTYIPFILISLVTVPAVIFYIFTARKSYDDQNQAEVAEVKVEEKSVAATSAPKKDDKQAIESLLQYKKLLDDGIITQEEFDAKKKELLNM